MDWPNERYVRLYVRLTPDQSVWCWQALAIWPWLLARADRSGMIETRKGALGIAGIVRMPIEVVEPGLAELLEDGCVRQVQAGFAIPNYVEAQTAISSDTKRQADKRARDRMLETLQRDDADKNVTRGHAMSRDVTESHAVSLRSDPSGTDPNREREALRAAADAAPSARKRASTPRTVKTLLPETWAPNPDHAAEAKRCGADLQAEVAKMRDWAASNGARKADWNATFRNWLRRAPPATRTQGNGGGYQRPPEPTRTTPRAPPPVVNVTREQQDEARDELRRLRAAGWEP